MATAVYGFATALVRLHAQGLPSISAQWGAWGAAGMVSNKPGLADHLAHLGLGLLRPQEGLYALSLMMRQAVTPAGASVLRKYSQSLSGIGCVHTAAHMPDCGFCEPWGRAGGGMAAVVASRLLWASLLVADRERSPFYAEHLHARQLSLRSRVARDVAMFQARLEAAAGRMGGQFVHYDSDASIWIVKVIGF